MDADVNKTDADGLGVAFYAEDHQDILTLPHFSHMVSVQDVIALNDMVSSAGVSTMRTDGHERGSQAPSQLDELVRAINEYDDSQPELSNDQLKVHAARTDLAKMSRESAGSLIDVAVRGVPISLLLLLPCY